ncbi:HNH/ENDO VII family nuclease [Aggregatibacter actinomycetemcomitans]|nr:HNH/ENDO VII family nuclease [Aggregatibacter actinomycetemcomitans]
MENLAKIQNSTQQEMLGKWVDKLSDGNPMVQTVESTKDLDEPIALEKKSELTPLSNESKAELKEKEYPDSVIENIGSEEEKTIYEEADLEPTEVNDRDALIKKDIDLNQEDDFGRTNLERMEQGLAPLDKDGNPIELHHVGQKMDSPLAELTRDEHRGKGNDTVLHNKQKESEINREDFAKERCEHWKARAEQIKSEMNA